MKVWLVGAGCGTASLTLQAREAIEQAELLIGAKRLLETAPSENAARIAEYRPGAILDALLERGPERACVLLSGDSGFYSGAAGLLPRLRARGIECEVLPGISSLQAFSAALGRPWQDWRLCSAHGEGCDCIREVMQGRPVFFLTSGAQGARDICRTLTEAGLGALPVYAGEALGTEKEKITAGTAREFAGRDFGALNVLLAEAAPVLPRRTPGIPDGEFLRGDVPMTKQYIRAAVLAELAVRPEDVCWDIGAGTGSVSVELAMHAAAVWAVERDPEALELARRNRERFRAWNLRLKEGTAPEALADLPAPDAVFVGGSGGRLKEILEAVDTAAPAARVCVSAIALETLHEAAQTLRGLGRHVEISQISVSRSSAAGNLHLLLARNPVFLVLGERP